MKKIYSCLLLCLLSATSFALSGPCTPGGVGTGFTGTTTYCVGATASPITYNYSECSLAPTGPVPTGVNCLATWYYNTTNTTVISGSTVTVSGPIAFTSAAGANGDLPTFTPVTTTAGTYYYFCVVTWTNTGAECASPFVTGTRSVTINSNPTPITGSSSVCVNSTIALSSTPLGGTWSSSNLANATVNSSTGVVTGMTAGTANISYTNTSTGCYAVKTIAIDPLPTPITGTAVMCMTETTTLSAGSGGTWSSSNGGVATVDASGVVTSVSAGTTIIDYTLSTGCSRSVVVTVNTTPAIIGGASTLCTGLTTTLTNSNVGGTWSSSNTSVATITSAGVVTAGSVGTTMITYTLPTGCYRTTVLAVNQTPAAITGTLAACSGSTSSLSNATSGGVWSSSSPSVASIDFATGVVTAGAVGTATISYVMGTGCRTVIAFTVNTQPAAIGGTTSICLGSISTLSNSTAGGSWSSSNTAVATIGTGTGVVTSVAIGTSIISYQLPNGCFSSAIVSVNSMPGAFTGLTSICTGGTTTLGNAVAGGTWTSGSPAIATIGSSTGIVNGVAAGTSAITYTLSTGCKAVLVETVNLTPAAITGSLAVCQNATSTLADATAGGTWSSSTSTVATITAGGVVIPATSTGTTTITYMMPSGCFRTAEVTVNAAPAVIGGPNTVCTGSTISLTNSVSGGVWSSSGPAATVISGTGVVTGVSASSAVTISYTLGNGCRATQPMTVYATPAAITGSTSVCLGAVSTLASTTTGGTWSSSNTSVATVGLSTGVVTSSTIGTTTISYILGSGCYTTATVSVNVLPAPISGAGSVCVGSSTSLTNGTSGGIWTSSNTAIATVGGGTGLVSGIAAGTTIISYSMPTGCRATTVMTVYALPVNIAGSSSVCLGSVVSLSNTTTGGSWSSSNSNAVVGSATGDVFGNSVGTSIITYMLPTGCYKTLTMTVQPVPAAIGGTTDVCIGSTTSLTNSTIGGTWTSSNISIATVGASSGVVTGAGAGTANISYTLATGCRAMATVTVNSLPANITGTTNVCVSSTITLGNATTGGTWSSGSTNASIDPTTGVVTGATAGTAVISYGLSTGCYKTLTITVNALPAAIGGALEICTGTTGTLTNATTGGTWSSSTTSVATIVPSTGVASGVSTGTSTITYRVTATGCVTNSILTVDPLPATISGTPTVCFGLTTTLSSSPIGGTWTSSNSNATVDPTTGEVTGAAVGTARITYTLSTGCIRTQVVTVNPLPASFSGSLAVCVGSTSALTSTIGGTWSSSNAAVGTIGATTGVLGGISGGNTNITYTLPTGCLNTAVATVNALPTAISGTMAICFGNSTSLSSTPATGTWASSNTSVATIDASGVVTTGTVSGTSTITYTLGTSCKTTSVLTVMPIPNSITGSTTVCTGLTSTLASTTLGGTWSSSNTAVATVSATGGIVTGVTTGTTIIDYTLATGCFRSVVVTVNQSPTPIGGTAAVCVGSTTTLTNGVVGGVWNSSNMSVAGIDAAGVVTGFAAGNSNITYTLGTCMATKVVTVNALPSAIGGTLVVCEGLTTSLSSTPAGGTWVSSSPANAMVGSTGVVTGVLAGTSTISYTLGTGCYRTAVVNVLAAPSSISGASTLCATTTTTLSNSVTGGAWNSSNPVVATVNTSGVVTGVAAGSVVITYTLPTGCSRTMPMTVNAVPSVITGAPVICENGTTVLASGPTGGVWSSNTPTVAIVSGTGTVIGVAAGTSIVDYTLATGCFRSVTVTVNPAPTVITGTTTICTGATSTLSSFPAGGIWSSSNAALASVDASGVVTGVAAGFVNITYTLVSGCTRVAAMTVNATPSNITGVTSICQGATASLSSSPAGGTWDSNTPSVAIVSSTGTLVTAIAPGTTTISYTLSTGCYKTTVATVNPVPDPIVAPTSLCVGASATFTNPTIGGNWTSGNPAVATVGFSSGLVSGVAPGVTTITYSLTSGCRSTAVLTVNSLPAVITGLNLICVGTTTTLGNATPGGSWSSFDGSVATIGSGTGVLTGVNPGTTTISYTMSTTGCSRTSIVTVSPLPAAITGSVNVCVGSASLLSNGTPGGTWTSSNTSVASIGSTTGLFVGNNSGTATVTYALSSGCYTTTPVTVNPLPAAISGGLNVCIGSISGLSTSTPGGTWLSGNPSVADVDPSGVVTGYSTGIAPISYTIGTGCSRVVYVTVNPLPAPIVGLHGICISSSTTLSSATSGGAWTSSNLSVATIGVATGAVTPASSGTTLISYTLSTGCRDTFTLTVHPLPSAITGTTVLCAGTSSTLSNSMIGGTWSSSSSVIASVGSSSGIVTGNSTGIAGITYSLGTGCRTTTIVTVNTIPAAITGVANVCEGSATILNNVTPGGTWSTENPTIATITPTGIVAGIAPNTVIISYTLSSGCARTIVVTVNPTPPAITGVSTLCIGNCITFTNDSVGGVWNSSNPSVASVGISTGYVCGLSGGTAMITYTLGTGCQAEYLVTVNTVPPAITGIASVCQGLTTTLSNAVSGGTWQSQTPSVATVGPTTGIVTGLTPGTDTIFYQLVGGCTSYVVVTVNPTPSVPTWSGTGSPNLCVGESTTMASVPGGGTWSSSNTAVATIGLSSGSLVGVTPGTSTITYTLGTGCLNTVDAVVNAMPAPITGIDHVCSGLTTTFYNTTPGGVWSTSNPSVASVDAATGAISGGSFGPATITYAITPTCMVSKGVTVDATPAVITGFLDVCAGSSTVLGNVSPGGVWSSTNTSVAPIGLTTGLVTGVSVGTATISYTLLGTGCATTAVMTVNAVPATIIGSATVCEAGTTNLTSTTIGGVWTVDNTSIAIVGSGTGVVQGLDSGSTVVTYQIPTTGCYTTKTIAVNPLPDPIAGASVVCEASTTTLTNVTPFGTWSSSNTSVATAGSTSGSVMGIGAGTTTITYMLGTGCYVTQQFTVDPVPAALLGVPHVCVGTTTYLSSGTAGGVWSTTNGAVASVAAGNVTGLTPGTSGISYTLSTGCAAAVIVTVEPTPTPIAGTFTICEGSSTTLGSTPFGGSWTSGTPSVATIDAATGVVNAIAAGTSLMTYATPVAGCYVTATVTVDPLPSAIIGISTVCEASQITLSNLSSGGSWSSDNLTVATIGSTGIVDGVSAGTATISYTMASGCAATGIVTVNPLPHAGTLTGASSVCKNSVITLASTVGAGKWYSKDTAVAKIDSMTGVVTGIDSGSTDVIYVYTNMCGTDTAAKTIAVNPLPNAGTITGIGATCIGYTTTLTSSVSGGVWMSSNPAIATVSTAGVVFGIAPGTVQIRYLLTTICGTDTTSVPVTIHGLAPHTPIAIHPDSVMCSKVFFQNFGASASPTTGYTYEWTAFNAEIFATNSSKQFALVNFPTPGTAVVTLTTHVMSSGCTMVDSFIASIGTTEAVNPEVRYYNSELICMDNTADSYQWGYDDATTLDSTLIAGQIHQDFYLPVPDFTNKLYWVMTQHFGCRQKSYYNAPTSVNSAVVADLDIRIFPNPANSMVNILVSGVNSYDKVEVRLLDMTGKDLYMGTFDGGKGRINVAELPSGIYSVMLTKDGVKIGARTFVKN